MPYKQFPATVQLGDLDGSTGFKIYGEAAGDFSGVAVNGAGDFNHDGVADLFIGARNADPTGTLDTGRGYALWGKWNMGSNGVIELASLTPSTGLYFDTNEAGTYHGFSSGYSTHSPFDFNGDGWGDLLIGAVNIGTGGHSYLLYGSPDTTDSGIFNYASLNGTNGFQINPEAALDGLGVSATPIGDFNGDQYSDLATCAYQTDPGGRINAGSCYVLYGRSTPLSTGTFDLLNLSENEGFKIHGEMAGDNLGIGCSSLGDINGDGYDDFTFSARMASPDNKTFAGRSYVLFGRPTPISGGIFNLENLNSSDGFSLDGEAAGDESGKHVASAGDINHDGYPDLFIGAKYSDPQNRTDAGRGYVVYGGPNISNHNTSLSTLNGTWGFRLNGELAGDTAGGQRETSAGDFNGDGITDFLVSAEGASPGGRLNAGACYLIFGREGLGQEGDFELSSIDGVNGIKFEGEFAGGFAGRRACSGVGDINDDGIDDIAIGATDLSPDGFTNMGRSYVVFGDSPPEVTLNQLNVNKGGVTVLNSAMLFAYDSNHAFTTLEITPRNVTQGQFEAVENPGIELLSFPYIMLVNKDIQFRHNNSLLPPSYEIIVTAPGGLASSLPSSANTSLNFPPVLLNNQLSTTEGESTTLRHHNFNATNLNSPSDSIFYRIGNLTGGWFNFIQWPQTAITQFWHNNVSQAVVQFTKDGSSVEPTCEIYLADEHFELGPFTTDTSNFTNINDAPIAHTSPLSIQQSLNDKTIAVIDNSLIQATDEETSDESALVCELGIMPQFGNLNIFQLGNSITLQSGSQITQADISSALFSYEIDNSLQTSFDSFTFKFYDPDGGESSEYAFPININPRPKEPFIETNQLHINGGRVKTLSLAELKISDPDTPDTELVITAYDVMHGHFAYADSLNSEIYNFTAEEIGNQQIAFVSDEVEIAPSYSLRVTDGDFIVPPLSSTPESATISFNAPPQQTLKPTIVDQGQPTQLEPTGFYAIDKESFANDLIFQVTNVTGGHIEYASNEGFEVTEFPQFPLIQGSMQYSQDGSDDEPGFSVRVSDRDIWSEWETATLTLNHKPLTKGTIPNQKIEESESSHLDVNLEKLFYDSDGDPLTYSATLEGGLSLPTEITFEVNPGNKTGTFFFLFNALASQSLLLTASDPRGLTAQIGFNVDTTPAFDYLSLYNLSATLGGIALAIGGYFWWRRRIAQHRREYPLANEIRKILNLQYYNFQDHLGDSYKQKIEQLIIHLNLTHDNFYAKLTPVQQSYFAISVADALRKEDLVSEATLSYGLTAWLLCFSRGWSQGLHLQGFQAALATIATQSIANWEEKGQRAEHSSPHLKRSESQHNRAIKAKSFCSSNCCASFWGAARRAVNCFSAKQENDEPESSRSKLPSSISMAVLSNGETNRPSSPSELQLPTSPGLGAMA